MFYWHWLVCYEFLLLICLVVAVVVKNEIFIGFGKLNYHMVENISTIKLGIIGL